MRAAPRRAPATRRVVVLSIRRRIVLSVAAFLGLAAVTAGPAAFGHAAGMPVTSGMLTIFKPTELPPVCATGSQTLTATSDTYVDQNNATNNFGTNTSMRVSSRATSRNMRSLVQFTLPSVPSGCTLAGATLRLNATGNSAGRTISVYQATAAWVETTVTWNTQPGETGTPVDVTVSGNGWTQWTVTTHVAAMYSGTNNGFRIRDANEDGAGTSTQTYSSRNAASNRPELVLTWG